LLQADILTFGDSFLDFSRMKTYPEQLGDTLHKRVFYERFINDHRPLVFLNKNNYVNSSPKILIYESAERYIPFRFNTTHDTGYTTQSTYGLGKTIRDIRDWIFRSDTEVKYTTLLNRSIFTNDLYSAISTIKFDVFGYITSQTPVYTLDHEDPWLFYHEEVSPGGQFSDFYYNHSEEEINLYCDNIADLRNKLKELYNLDLIFMPIPSKYTIYHKLINNDTYNNFLPRLYEGLADRGVPFIDLYNEYINSDEILYYGTDTHWNKKGLDIAVDKTLEYIKSSGIGSYIAFDSAAIKEESLTH